MNPVNVGLAVFSFGIGLYALREKMLGGAIVNFAASGLNAALAVI